MDYKAMFAKIKDIHEKSGKNRVWIFFDMVHCGRKFGAGYMDYWLYEIYNLTDAERDTYITRGRNYELVKRYNDPNYTDLIDNKIEFNKRFGEFLGRKWIEIMKDNKQEVIDFINGHEFLMAKADLGSCGKTVEEYVQAVERLGDTDADLLEINVSCPNVKEGGIAFGQNPDALFEITKEIKKHAKQPIIMKLSPNVTSIAEMARAAEAAGSDAISLINTITGMKIDIYKKTFAIANKTGGLSGPAIKPVAVRMVYEASNAVKIPVIGMGGIATAEDAIEFMLAGASAVAVGAMNFHDPYATIGVIEGIERYLEEQKIADINEIIGAVK